LDLVKHTKAKIELKISLILMNGKQKFFVKSEKNFFFNRKKLLSRAVSANKPNQFPIIRHSKSDFSFFSSTVKCGMDVNKTSIKWKRIFFLFSHSFA
jgi:hypothetical protein